MFKSLKKEGATICACNLLWLQKSAKTRVQEGVLAGGLLSLNIILPQKLQVPDRFDIPAVAAMETPFCGANAGTARPSLNPSGGILLVSEPAISESTLAPSFLFC